MDVKETLVPFAKSRRAITGRSGTITKFQIPALTNRGHCISCTAVLSANDATLQLCAEYERTRRMVRDGLLLDMAIVHRCVVMKEDRTFFQHPSVLILDHLMYQSLV